MCMGVCPEVPGPVRYYVCAAARGSKELKGITPPVLCTSEKGPDSSY